MIDSSLKDKVARIEAGLREMLRAEGVEPQVLSFGAFDIDPRYLVFVLGVETDAQKQRLGQRGGFLQRARALLVREDWPAAARDHVTFSFESQETVDRESGGNWYQHFK